MQPVTPLLEITASPRAGTPAMVAVASPAALNG
jgi:hypothetical protein